MSFLVSVVVPMFNEEGNVEGLINRFDAIVADNPDYRFEFVVVDDGSTDGSSEAIKHYAESRRDLRAVVLSRNFGSHYALSAGLDQCHGDVAVIVGADAQEPVDLVARMLASWKDGHEIVWGIREQRADQGAVSRFVSELFSRLLRRYSVVKTYPAEGPSAFLLDRLVIDVVNKLTEHNRNVAGLLAWSGFRQGRVTFRQLERTSGESKWTGKAKIKLAVDSFVEFSFTPIRFVTFSGIAIASVGFVYAAFLVTRRLFFSDIASGWTTVVVVALLLGGFQLVVLGVLGEYIWRGVDESRGRPLFIVREVVGPDPVDPGHGSDPDP
jgi:dolichol-phosphate mannosyltransferase